MHKTNTTDDILKEQFRELVKEELLKLMVRLQPHHPDKTTRCWVWVNAFINGITGIGAATAGLPQNPDEEKILFSKLCHTVDTHIEGLEHMQRLRVQKLPDIFRDADKI